MGRISTQEYGRVKIKLSVRVKNMVKVVISFSVKLFFYLSMQRVTDDHVSNPIINTSGSF